MKPDEEAAPLVGRRQFLRLTPKYLTGGVRALVSRVDEKAAGQIAVIDISRCLAWAEAGCQLCYLRCPLRDEAVMLSDGKPCVVVSACNGCGVCVEACRAVNDLGAIRLMSEPVSAKPVGEEDRLHA